MENHVLGRELDKDIVTRKSGRSNTGKLYRSIEDFWRSEVSDSTSKWHEAGREYWESDKVPATIDGVLGGFAHVSGDDVDESRKFLTAISKRRPDLKFTKAVDCGSGIGRVALNLLVPMFEVVDIVEQSPKLIAVAKDQLSPTGKVDQYYCTGLQDWTPAEGSYDCIWIQWCIGHLPDAELVSFLQRCKKGLTKGGIIGIKENDCTLQDAAFLMDTEDMSVTRSVVYFKSLFKKAGLSLVVNPTKQVKFPKDLFEVYMYALE